MNNPFWARGIDVLGYSLNALRFSILVSKMQIRVGGRWRGRWGLGGCGGSRRRARRSSRGTQRVSEVMWRQAKGHPLLVGTEVKGDGGEMRGRRSNWEPQAYWVGPQCEKEKEMRWNNMITVLASVGLVWMGWSGFNGEGLFAASTMASLAILNTHVCRTASVMVWVLLNTLYFGKPTMFVHHRPSFTSRKRGFKTYFLNRLKNNRFKK
ncbi:hypothetical protein Fmac_015824 [Flemingia macrophylla]|uniref:Ammonium transporter AmtB-like domain-containing protein n=1 Tax=Flemingia macrophylla TaxID=520843 RepID=A0ABD1MFQ5_9FABA